MTGKRDPAKLSDNERVERARLAKDHAAWSARIAEYEGSQSVADIVAQLRRRARVANTRAIGVLIVLIMAVLFGLAAYVVWPVVRQYVDGQRAELQRALEAIEAVDRDLSRDRSNTIKSIGSSLDDLGDVVTNGVPFESDLVVIGNTGHFDLSDGGVIVYGHDGGVLRIDKDGTTVDAFLTSESKYMEGHVALKTGAHVLYGPDGVFRINEDGKTHEPLFFQERTYFSTHFERQDGSVLIFGDHTVVRVDADGELATQLTPASDVEYDYVLPLADGKHVLYGWQSAVLLDEASASATVIATVPDVYLSDHVQLDDGTHVVTGYGVAIAINDDGNVTRQLEVTDPSGSFNDVVLPDGTIFMFDRQRLLRAGPQDLAFQTLDTTAAGGLQDHVALKDGTILFYGDKAILRISQTGNFIQEKPLGDNQQLYNHGMLDDGTVLMFGRGSIYRYDPVQQNIEEFFVQGDIGVSGATVLGDGSVLIYGSGRVLHVSSDLETVEVLFSSAEDRFFDHETLQDGAVLLFGANSALIVAKDGQSAELLASLDNQIELRNVAVLADGSTLLYGDGPVLSVSEDRGTVKQHDLTDDENLTSHTVLENGTVMLYGGKGAVYAFDPNSQNIEYRPSGTLAPLVGHAKLQGGDSIFYSPTGAVTKFPGTVAQSFDALLSDIKGFSDADQDQAIRIFLQEELSDYAFAAKDAALNQINTIIAQRTVLATRKLETQATQDDLPTGAYFLQQQRQSFRQFMQDCRGVTPVAVGSAQAGTPQANGVAGDPDEITLACTQAWMKKLEAEAGTWWQTLAQQIPPGILLLFLLATLGALYRYNLRLAGFHASRADLLELMSMGQPSSKNMFVEWDKDNFSRITEALAADKVEFGKGTLPTDQAISMAQAMLNR
ncbi:MAG: hypothetical protein AAFZ04_08510 [Pseudomonadota bacterium]